MRQKAVTCSSEIRLGFDRSGRGYPAATAWGAGGRGGANIEAARQSGGRPPAEAPPAAIHYRDSLVVVLTLTTGAMDAVTFVRLGKVFSSVITGNLALLGVAAGQHEAGLAVNGGLALAGYACGVMVGGAVARVPTQSQPVWPVRVTIALAVELALLAAFSGGWLAAGGHPAGADRLALLPAGAAAMGVQSAAVRRLGQMSSTYLTSTLTGILTSIAIRRLPSEWQRSTGVLIAIIIGAALGALAATRAPSLVPVAVLTPLAAVLMCALPAVSRVRKLCRSTIQCASLGSGGVGGSGVRGSGGDRGIGGVRGRGVRGRGGVMKKLLELLVCLIHPVAVVLMWVNLASRSDLSGTEKLAWALFGLIPLVPFLYVLTGGNLW